MSLTYPIVDTNQTSFYGNSSEISEPAAGQSFHGQDAHYTGLQPSYRDNGDGTVSDLNTGLMWQQAPGGDMSFAEAVAGADSFELAGYDDWRLPTIEELYSLIDFSGYTGQAESDSSPYIDTDYFTGFAYGDTSAGERMIDAQYWSATEYVGLTMNGDATTFGVNFADGRIKGYPSTLKECQVMYVRGNESYGVNSYFDNGDGTVNDEATGLMWMQADSGYGMDWQDALAYAESLSLAGYDDWRLPNIKELHSIADYGRAPAATDAGGVPSSGRPGPAAGRPARSAAPPRRRSPPEARPRRGPGSGRCAPGCRTAPPANGRGRCRPAPRRSC
ncbi:MAG: DUF1566 domain-containing protein [Caulobacter sp.]|nr:DUF1566 domain-containing protein [Caulobacter sp.]